MVELVHCFLNSNHLLVLKIETSKIQIIEGSHRSWKVLEFEMFPGKSWDVLNILKNSGKVLEFYTIFVCQILFPK